MRRKVMDRGFRRIKAAPVVAEPQPDPRLALVDLFRDAQVYRDPAVEPDAPLPEGALVLSGDEPMRVTADGSLEPAVRPVEDESVNSPVEVSEAADEAQAKPEPVLEPDPRVQVQDEQDYDPIAAVLG